MLPRKTLTTTRTVSPDPDCGSSIIQQSQLKTRHYYEEPQATTGRGVPLETLLKVGRTPVACLLRVVSYGTLLVLHRISIVIARER